MAPSFSRLPTSKSRLVGRFGVKSRRRRGRSSGRGVARSRQTHLSRWYCAVAWAASVRGVSVLGSPCLGEDGEAPRRRGRSASLPHRRPPRCETKRGTPPPHTARIRGCQRSDAPSRRYEKRGAARLRSSSARCPLRLEPSKAGPCFEHSAPPERVQADDAGRRRRDGRAGPRTLPHRTQECLTMRACVLFVLAALLPLADGAGCRLSSLPAGALTSVSSACGSAVEAGTAACTTCLPEAWVGTNGDRPRFQRRCSCAGSAPLQRRAKRQRVTWLQS